MLLGYDGSKCCHLHYLNRKYAPNISTHKRRFEAKTEDLLSIVNVYGLKLDFKLIFTKEDETLTLGNILNVCYKSKKSISYITNGQSVPNDIKVISPERVAELILS